MKASPSLLLATAFLFGASEAENNETCNDIGIDIFVNGVFNATGSVSVPGPRIDESSPQSTWTWSAYRGIEAGSDSNNPPVWTTLGLKTSPVQNLTDPNIPYRGCLMSIYDLSESVFSRDHKNDNGSCNTVFSDTCVRAILDNVRSNALAPSKQTGARADIDRCVGILNSYSLSSKGGPCEGQLGAGSTSPFISPPSPAAQNTSTSSCPVPNPGDSDAGSRAFMAWLSSPTGTQNSEYDQALLNPVVLLSVLFSKSADGTNGTSPASGFVDVQLMCIPTNITEPGSRNLSQASGQDKAKSAAVGHAKASFALLGTVAIGMLFGFAL